jgi:hypothetical protein
MTEEQHRLAIVLLGFRAFPIVARMFPNWGTGLPPVAKSLNHH